MPITPIRMADTTTLDEAPLSRGDVEIEAIRAIGAAFGRLDEAAQDRVAAWVFDRYRVQRGGDT